MGKLAELKTTSDIVKDVLDAYDVEEMIAGDYHLTLFTCTKDRQHRMTIRCNMIEK